MSPYFSIVTEVYNRESTIERTVTSVLNQSFLDFEYIIINFESTDNSSNIIQNIIKKTNSSKNITYIEKKFEKNEINRWNEPLKYATGKYIVVLEGDDWFDNDYLLNAHYALEHNENIGIYVGVKPNIKNNFNKIVFNKIIYKEFKRLNFAPPPSEAIFIRKNFNNKPYYYDEKKYVWAGEYSLYKNILADGYDVYFEDNSKNCYVNRGISKRKHSIKHVLDMIIISKEISEDLNKIEKKTNQNKIANKIGTTFALQLFQFRFELRLFILFLEYSLKNIHTLISFFLIIIKHLKSKFL